MAARQFHVAVVFGQPQAQLGQRHGRKEVPQAANARVHACARKAFNDVEYEHSEDVRGLASLELAVAVVAAAVVMTVVVDCVLHVCARHRALENEVEVGQKILG